MHVCECGYVYVVCVFLCVRLWSCMSMCCMYMCVLCACVRVYMVSMYALIVCLSKWLCVCVFRFAVGEQVEVFVDAVKRRLHARYIKVNMISLIVIILELGSIENSIPWSFIVRKILPVVLLLITVFSTHYF